MQRHDFSASHTRRDILFLLFSGARARTTGKSKRQERTSRTKARAPSAILLAAGPSSRFHGTKVLALVHGRSMIERAVDAIPSEGLEETVAVLGRDADAVARAIGHRDGVRVVVNPDFMEGMASSIRVGLRALSRGAPGALVVLADQPFVTRRLLSRVLKAFAESGGTRIVAATSGGLVAPPVVFPKRFFGELVGLSEDKGARSVIEKHQEALKLVRVKGKEALSDVDSRKDLEDLGLLEP